MAKGRNVSPCEGTSRAAVDRAAEAVGRTIGTVARSVDALRAQHPHPVDEARKTLAAGRKTLARAKKAVTLAAQRLKG